MIGDGLSITGGTLEAWAEGRCPPPRRGLLPRMALAIGTTVPPLTDVAGAETAVLARLDYGRWCADCPCGSASLVWLAGPHLIWCGSCGNRAIGGSWRPVTVPANWGEINAAVADLDTKDQNWMPGSEG